jgi:hypothetical protein
VSLSLNVLTDILVNLFREPRGGIVTIDQLKGANCTLGQFNFKIV